MGTNPVRLFVRVLMSAWALWWLFFAVASVLAGPASFGQKALVCLLAGAFFVGSAAVAFLDRPWRPVFLIIEGAILTYLMTLGRNPPPVRVFLLVTLALPPLLAGILTIGCCPRRRPFPG